MPRIDLNEEEIEIIRERRRKMEVVHNWNDGMLMGVEIATTVFLDRFGGVLSENQISDAKARIADELQKHERRLK